MDEKELDDLIARDGMTITENKIHRDKVEIVIDLIEYINLQSEQIISLRKLANTLKDEIHAAILADREARKLDVEKVYEVIKNKAPCYCKEDNLGNGVCDGGDTIQELANSIVSAFNAPEKAIPSSDKEYELKKEIFNLRNSLGIQKDKTQILELKLQAIHDLINGGEYATENNSILGKAFIGGKKEDGVCEWKRTAPFGTMYSTNHGLYASAILPENGKCDSCGRKIKVVG